jgi:putative spermidine/putrescine transport system substrate-binding protein
MKRFIKVTGRILFGTFLMNLFLLLSPPATPANEWESVLNSSRGTRVTFYGWGGDPRVNSWLDTFVAPRLKERYGISLERVGMNIGEILNKLLSEKTAGKSDGVIDVVWINGENFFAARQNGLLFGPFTGSLPNFRDFVDAEAGDVAFDFGFPTEGFEAPYGKAQLVFFRDAARLKMPISGHRELLEAAKAHPGEITYPAPPDFTGSAFVRNIICDIVGREKIAFLPADKDVLRETVAPAMKFLSELKPYLWMNGESYPASSSQIKNMFEDGEILLGMSYTPFLAPGKVKTGEFPESTESFVFEKGTLGNTHFLAIPFNASNKNGAMVLINTILDPEVQASKYDPAVWGDLPVLDPARLSAERIALFESIVVGKGSIPLRTLLEKRVPELPATFIPILDEIWRETVLR